MKRATTSPDLSPLPCFWTTDRIWLAHLEVVGYPIGLFVQLVKGQLAARLDVDDGRLPLVVPDILEEYLVEALVLSQPPPQVPFDVEYEGKSTKERLRPRTTPSVPEIPVEREIRPVDEIPVNKCYVHNEHW